MNSNKDNKKSHHSKKLMSICIPTYEMDSHGYVFLEHSFKILLNQTFKNFEVMISDHSKDNLIKNLCYKYKDKLDINYIKNLNDIGSSSANINNAIKNAQGKLIKILFQDDFLYDEHSLMNIIENFNLKNDKWLVTACIRSKDGTNFYGTFYPKYDKNIHLGKNTISSPSVLTIKNEHPVLFDENLIWLMDCDYYKRCYDRFGEPKIVNKISVVNRIGSHQITNTLATEVLKNNEYIYIKKKYNKNNPPILTKNLIKSQAKDTKNCLKMFKKYILTLIKSRLTQLINKKEELLIKNNPKVNTIFKSIIKNGDLVFDVGANTGDKSEIFLQFGAKVIGFEPQPKCAKQCSKRFNRNNNFLLENIGLNSSKGTSIIYESNANTISSMSTEFINAVKKERFSNCSWDRKIPIRVDTLDHMITKYGKPKFIKIDVEGYELNVLKGLTQPIDFISIEFTPELQEKTTACLEYLENINKNISFNYVYRNDESFMYPQWISKDEMLSYLKSVNDYKFEFGDVYIKKI